MRLSLKRSFCFATLWLLLLSNAHGANQPLHSSASNHVPAGVTQPLSLADCLDLALSGNRTILKSRQDLEATHGLVVQTRAIAIPKVQVQSNYRIIDKQSIDRIPVPPIFPISYPDQSWSAQVQLVQSIYEGGRIRSALHSARYLREQALAAHQAVISDVVLEMRIAYDDALMAAQQIVVQEASINLLSRELEDTLRRFEAGTVPRFNVLRAEVELANARPRLIRARNTYRISKHNLVHLMGLSLPKEVGEDAPLELSGKLEALPYPFDLPVALAKALEHRSELHALRAAENLRQESLKNARAGYKPSVQVLTGYGSRSSTFSTDLTRDVSGWFAGAQLSWDIFDGLLTQGRIQEARALHRKAQLEMDDASRRVELEVRTAYSDFIQAREVLESQKKVQEQAEEALRLATARAEAGSSTQLDVLNAQTALTEARTTQIQALRDYSVAVARLDRAIGQSGLSKSTKTQP